MTDSRALPLELFPPSKGGAVALVGETTRATQRYVELFEGAQWTELLDHVVRLAGLAERTRTYAASSGVMIAASSEYLRERDRGLTASMTSLESSTSPSAGAFKQSMLDELQRQLGNREGQDTLDKILAGDHALFRSSRALESGETRSHDLLATSFTQLASLTSRATLEATRSLAQGMTASSKAVLMQGDQAALAMFADEGIQFEQASFSRLHDLLEANAPLSEFADAATAIHARAALLLEPLGSTLGGYLGLVENTVDAITKREQMRIALRASECAERLMVLVAYTALIRVEAAGRAAGRWYGHERRRLKTRQKSSGVPQGEPMELADLTANVPSGKLVQVEGEVRNIRILDDPSPPKFSTMIDLTDLVTGHSVPVRAHMFSLINNNVADGTYVRLNGFVRKGERWLSEPVGLDIDRVNLTELHRDHWYDDVVHRVRKNTLLYLDGMNMFFTPGFSQEGS